MRKKRKKKRKKKRNRSHDERHQKVEMVALLFVKRRALLRRYHLQAKGQTIALHIHYLGRRI
jgi:hypothetical protein